MEKYSIFVPEKINNLENPIEIGELSKKDIEDSIKSSLDDKIYINRQYTYFKKDDKLYLTYFKDILADTKKGFRALVPIYSLFKTFTKDNKDISIIGSTKYGVITVFMGDLLVTYEYGFHNEQSFVQSLITKRKTMETQYAGKRNVKVLIDTEFDNISAKEIEFESLDISLLDKSEILEYKSKMEMILEQVNIKVKFNLNLKEMVKIVVQSSLMGAIGYVLYMNHLQQKQLDGFYGQVKNDVSKSMGEFNKKLLKDSTTSFNPIINSLNEVKTKINDMSKKQDMLTRGLENNHIEIKEKIDNMVLKVSHSSSNIVNPNPITNMLNNKSIDDKIIDNKKTQVIEEEISKKVQYKILVKSDTYVKLQIDGKIISLFSKEAVNYKNKNLLYIGGFLYIDNKKIELKDNGFINL